MFSIFKIFKKKKIVPHIRLSGVIGSVGKFKQGLDFAGQKEIIEKAFSIKKSLAIAISINSPGGSPQGSDELANYLIDFQKKVPTTFYIQNVCASGCYYIASAIHRDKKNPETSGIIANVNSIVGSIGVVLPHLVYGPALKRLGINNEYITEGDFKVPIDSWSLASEESKAYIKSNLLAPVYKTFQNFVQENRGLKDDEFDKLTGGRIFISSLVVGTLVDELSTYYEVREAVKKSVEKRFPEDEVGFVHIDTQAQRPSILSTMFTIENLNISTDLLNKQGLIVNTTQMQ